MQTTIWSYVDIELQTIASLQDIEHGGQTSLFLPTGNCYLPNEYDPG